MPVSVKTAPAAEPVTLLEAKAQLRVSDGDEDEYINTLIAAARNYAEIYLGRTLIKTTLVLSIDQFPNTIELPRSPVQSIASIKYIDPNGAEQTLPTADYQQDLVSFIPRICASHGKAWPTTQAQLNAVTVEYIAGYGDDETTIPQSIKHAMLLLIGHWFENREAVLVGSIQTSLDFTIKALLNPYRISALI